MAYGQPSLTEETITFGFNDGAVNFNVAVTSPNAGEAKAAAQEFADFIFTGGLYATGSGSRKTTYNQYMYPTGAEVPSDFVPED